MTIEKKVFNASESMGDWDPAVQKANGDYYNVFVDGHEYECLQTGLEKPWTRTEKCAMVDLGDGKLAHSMYVGSCMVAGEGVVVNQGKDPKFLCALTPGVATKAKVPFTCVQDYVGKAVRNGAFPKFLVKETLPVALLVSELKDADEDTKKNYADFFNMKWEEIIKDTTFLPSVKRATKGSSEGKLFQTKRSIVEITDKDSTLVRDRSVII